MSSQIILVVNLGLKSVRAIAFSVNGNVLAQASKPIQTYVSNERVEQDPNNWKKLAWQVIKQVTDEIKYVASDIRYLTVTTSASCLVALDEKGRPLQNSLLVSDSRAVNESRMLARTVEFKNVESMTGYPCSPDLMIPKMLWLSRHQPEVFEHAHYFVNAGDFLVGQLTGRFVTDPNNAMKFHYMVTEKSYPHYLLESLGIDAAKLPEVVEMGNEVGTLIPAVASELGLPNNCMVIMSTYDALAAVSGSGAFNVGEAVDVSGTVTSFRAVTNHHLFDEEKRIYVSPYLGKHHWLAGGSNNLGGGIIEWLSQLLFSRVEDPYTEMVNMTQDLSPCPGGLIFLPHLLGERAPIWNPDCRGVFFGMNRAHGEREVARAILEGVGFSVRHIAQVLRNLDVDIKSVTVSGGLVRLDVVNQIKADMLNVPVKKLGNFETTSIGAALIGLIGTGVYETGAEGFKKFCKVDRIFEPDKVRSEIYDEYFQLYLKVYDSLQDAYQARADLLARINKKGMNELVMAENL